MSIFGYGRVSRDEQTSENQKHLMEVQLKMKLDKWYEDHFVSGSVKAAERPMFSKLLSEAVSGDTVVFSRVDRVGRRASDILNTVEGLLERGVEVYIIQLGREPLSSPMGKMALGVFAVFAENERLSIIERTKAGLARTQAQGTKLGQPLKIHPTLLRKLCIEKEEGATLDELAKKYKVPRNSIARNISKWKDAMEAYEEEFNARKKQYKGKKAA